jgi:L-amino acid N-acyltransferase YncA
LTNSDVMLVARAARLSDAATIARIYNQGIEDRVATFETEPRSSADIERLLQDRAGRFSAIVVERDGQVVAWPSAGSYRARPCYDPIAEHSVYVDRAQRGRRVGRVALNHPDSRRHSLLRRDDLISSQHQEECLDD